MKKTFPDTSWSLLGAAHSGESEAAERFYRIYYPVIVATIANSFRFPRDAAEDMAQAFFEQRVYGGQWLGNADPRRGQFRGLLIVSLRNFVRNELRRDAARARTLEMAGAEARISGEPTVEDVHAFDIAWADTLLKSALSEARDICHRKDQPEYWQLYQMRILDPILHDVPPPTYSECLGQCGLDNVSTACNALATVNRRVRRAMERALAAVHGEDDVYEELSNLRERLSQQPDALASAAAKLAIKAT